MRLLKARDIEFLTEDERDGRTLPYAILSHRWEPGEVLFADMINGTAKDRPGYSKVQAACRTALERLSGGPSKVLKEYDYIWIDNCCIDKSSSAELSESLNSMFRWYQEADTCYAYLSDVPADIGIQDPDFEARLGASKWFGRGWTLQELLAPKEVIFFSQEWTIIGTKTELRGALSRITGIDEEVLEDSERIETASVAKRMSWAARRITTRPEDQAYCLMGLFSVNMPMLYGEGGVRAFWRLQEEIMKVSDDQSIFAWKDEDDGKSIGHGLLADRPSAFAQSSNIRPYEDREPRPYAMTNRGLSINLPLSLSKYKDDTWLAALECLVPPAYSDTSLAIYLKKLPGHLQYARVNLGSWGQVRQRGAVQTVHVRQNVQKLKDHRRAFRRHIFQLRWGSLPTQGQVVEIILPADTGSAEVPPVLSTSRTNVTHWCPDRHTFNVARGARQLAVALVLKTEEEQIVIMLGSAMVDFQIGYDVIAAADVPSGLNFRSMQDVFRPRPFGEGISLEHHDVNVTATETIYGGDKYYFIDVSVRYNPPPPSITEQIGDRLEELVYGPYVGDGDAIWPPTQSIQETVKQSVKSKLGFLKRRQS